MDEDVPAERQPSPAASAFQSVRSSLREVGLPVPNRPTEQIGTAPAVNVFILPGDEDDGMLETLLWCARLTGEGQPVEVRRKEGVTNHFRPESCAGRCEAAGEALTGARTGRAIEHRKRERLERRDCHSGRRQHRHHRNGEGMAGSTVSENPCTFVRPSSGPGRSSFCPGSRTGAAAGRRIPYPMMHGMKKSDEAIVPVKAANKGAQTPAESPEGRASTKGNLRDQSTHRT